MLKHTFYSKCHHEFHWKYPGIDVHRKLMIGKLFKKIKKKNSYSVKSVLGNIKKNKRWVYWQEILDEVGYFLARSPRISDMLCCTVWGVSEICSHSNKTI